MRFWVLCLLVHVPLCALAQTTSGADLETNLQRCDAAGVAASIKHGASPSALDRRGEPALLLAVEWCRDETRAIRVVSTLLSAGAKAAAETQDGRSAFLAAIELGATRLASFLLQQGGASATKSGDYLVAAVYSQNLELLRLLLAKHFDPNSLAVHYHALAYTPLAEAVAQIDVPAVKALLDAGADPNIPGGPELYTPVFYLIDGVTGIDIPFKIPADYASIGDALAKHKVDLARKDKSGETFLDVALSKVSGAGSFRAAEVRAAFDGLIRGGAQLETLRALAAEPTLVALLQCAHAEHAVTFCAKGQRRIAVLDTAPQDGIFPGEMIVVAAPQTPTCARVLGRGWKDVTAPLEAFRVVALAFPNADHALTCVPSASLLGGFSHGPQQPWPCPVDPDVALASSIESTIPDRLLHSRWHVFAGVAVDSLLEPSLTVFAEPVRTSVARRLDHNQQEALAARFDAAVTEYRQLVDSAAALKRGISADRQAAGALAQQVVDTVVALREGEESFGHVTCADPLLAAAQASIMARLSAVSGLAARVARDASIVSVERVLLAVRNPLTLESSTDCVQWTFGVCTGPRTRWRCYRDQYVVVVTGMASESAMRSAIDQCATTAAVAGAVGGIPTAGAGTMDAVAEAFELCISTKVPGQPNVRVEDRGGWTDWGAC